MPPFSTRGMSPRRGHDALYIGYGCPENTTIGDHRIYDNTFRDANSNIAPGGPWPSILFTYYGSGTGMTFLPSTIERNVFEDNDMAIGYSCETDTVYPADVVGYNSFTDNDTAVSVWGTYASYVLNAEYNYWGAFSGPYHDPNNLDGEGDEVSDDVDYDPWLTAPLCISDNPYPLGDLDYDYDVDGLDYAIFTLNWLEGFEE